MASTRKKKTAVAEPPLTDEELSLRVRSVLRGAGLKASDLAKHVGKIAGTRAVELARDLARTNEVHCIVKGQAEWFFGADPVATLDRVVPELLRREGALDGKRLVKAVEATVPGHGWFVSIWMKSAVTRGVIHEQAPRPGSKTKTYGAEPDLKLLLKKPLAELSKLLGTLDGRGISRERVAEFLRGELGATAASPKRSSRELFLDALSRLAADNPQGALLPVRELRARAGLAKHDFDAAALALSKEGLLVLHHHDHAAALSEADQSSLVRDALGRHYVGVALRGSA